MTGEAPAYDAGNVFAKMLRKEIPVEAFYEDDDLLVIRDLHPAAPVHFLALPKGDYTSFDDFACADPSRLGRFFAGVGKAAAKAGLREGGYRLIANHGSNAHQTVPHFHVHILGGKPLGPLLAGDALER